MKKAGIPVTLDLNTLLKEHQPKFKYHIDYFYYLLGTITELKIKDKDKHDDDFVELYSPLLQKKVHNYKQYLDYLLEHDVLITDGQYIKGEKSKAYWYHPRFHEDAFAVVEIQ